MGRKRKLESTNIQNDSKVQKLSAFWPGSDKKCESENALTEDLMITDARTSETPEKLKVKRNFLAPKRMFRDAWKNGRPWLEYDPVAKLMFCWTCKRAQVRNTFTSGCSVFKSESLTKHETAKGDNSHAAAVKLVKASQNFENAQQALIQKAETSVTAGMKNIYFMAQNNLPNSMFGVLNQHCIDQGCTDLSGLKVDKHTNYEHSDSVDSFQTAICDVIKEDLLKSVQDKPYSLMIDESTDISVDQNVVMYIRYLDQSLGRFEPKSCLLAVRQLREGATADKICGEILECLRENDLDVESMCGIATDGASVMVGRRTGVTTRLKQLVPGLLSSHCIAHKLALASGSAADSVPYLLKYQETLNAIFKYFQQSLKNMARLERVREVLHESGKVGTRFKQVFHTRWLSFEGSVRAVCDNYGELVSVLSEDKGAKGQGLLKSVSCYKFLHCSFFMADVLKQLCILCKAFQSSSVEFSAVDGLLRTTVSKIEELVENESGVMFESLRGAVPSGCESGTFEFRGHVVRDSEKQRREAKSACSAFTSNLLVNLKTRFADKDDALILSSMCSMFDPLVFGGEGEKETVCVEKVADHLGVEHTELKQELDSFVSVVTSSYAHCANSVNDVCQLVFKNRDTFPLLCKCATKLLTVPVASVECERGFSRQNLIIKVLKVQSVRLFGTEYSGWYRIQWLVSNTVVGIEYSGRALRFTFNREEFRPHTAKAHLGYSSPMKQSLLILSWMFNDFQVPMLINAIYPAIWDVFEEKNINVIF